MRGYKRWVFVFSIALSIIGTAIANANPVAPDTAAAESAIAEAEAAVRQAQAERALWTSAEDALRKARRALQEGDTTMAVKQARIAQKQSELGIAQRNYPPFR
jgi:murein lipoprotein